MIKSTQLKATKYDNYTYLQWIPYNDLTNIEKIGEGGFATISKATWLNREKYINSGEERTSEDRTVALKKLHNSQNISDEFLNEVNYFTFLFIFIFLNIIVVIKYFICYFSSKIIQSFMIKYIFMD